jgi:uncharacterized protein YgbK (DUF1537 family)
LRRAGLRTVILFDTANAAVVPDSNATVVALKTRTIPVAEAVAQSLVALAWLRAHGATQIFFKYCSTFDSRPHGNIGPVADALSTTLGASRTVFAPASPVHLRTQYMGHLFVDRLLLSESSMKNHPLTPMTQSYLPAVLAQQTDRGVGLIDHRDVREGAGRIAQRLEQAQVQATPYVLVDAICEEDLEAIGSACADDVLVTGAAGLAAGLATAHVHRLGRQPYTTHTDRVANDANPGVVLAGSCSVRTLQQIDHMKRNGHPSLQLDAAATPDAEALATHALQWYDRQDPADGPLIYSSLPPIELRRIQDTLSAQHASDILERAMGTIARGLVGRGVNRLIIAGGETSGAVVTALGVHGGLIGEEAAPGVPWILVAGPHPIALLLKSGNFGDPQMLARTVAGKPR